MSGPPGLRRLWRVDRATGAISELDLRGRNVWDFSWDGATALAAIVSADPSESGWYTATIAVFDLGAAARLRGWWLSTSRSGSSACPGCRRTGASSRSSRASAATAASSRAS